MKGLLLFACICLAKTLLMAQTAVLEVSNNQSIATLQTVAAPYFKTVPFNKSFSQFLQELINDPDLQQKEVSRRTDSTFFFAGGTYKRFNPFLYRPTTVKITVAEAEFSESDSSSYRDTVVYYQLIVTADSTSQGEQFVKKEYQRLLRKHDKKFTYSAYPLYKDKPAGKGDVAICFMDLFAVSPLTVAWGREEGSRNFAFSISFRMKVQENRATMVTLPQEPIRNQ